MQLISAIFLALLKQAFVVAGLMAFLFVGYLALAEAIPSIQEGFYTPEHLQQLEEEGQRHAAEAGYHRARQTAQTSRRIGLRLRLHREEQRQQQRLDDAIAAVEETTSNRITALENTLQNHRAQLQDSTRQLESQYCDSLNPVHWWSCRQVRQRIERIEERADAQRRAASDAVDNLRDQAQDQIDGHRADADEAIAHLQRDVDEQLQDIDNLSAELEDQLLALHHDVDHLRDSREQLLEDNWIWLEFRERWPTLLLVALFILAAPFIRRTLWYYLGMPLVSRADPIRLSTTFSNPDPDAQPQVHCHKGQRSLSVELPPDQPLLARSGYIQSDRTGAKSEIFFDRDAPNLSFISGLVLLTHLPSATASDDDSPRKVQLGTPDDPDAYLMRVDLSDHPGLVLRASHVVAVTGDIAIDTTWRLSNLHAWATSQVRFIVFSGTGSLFIEGHGDVQGRVLDGGTEQKRMPLVIGFDTRLTYRTQRSATFLPYLIDPGREPLVVDVFQGDGAVFFEKNPSVRKQRRSAGEAIAGFFLDAFRKLLGL